MWSCLLTTLKDFPNLLNLTAGFFPLSLRTHVHVGFGLQLVALTPDSRVLTCNGLAQTHGTVHTGSVSFLLKTLWVTGEHFVSTSVEVDHNDMNSLTSIPHSTQQTM
jgi:hypothetical protein